MLTPRGPRVLDLIEGGALTPHFQPIARLTDGVVDGHEALIRTAPGCPWGTPDELFAAARLQNATIALEIECLRLALAEWGRYRGTGRLFLNLSASALVMAVAQLDLQAILSASLRGAAQAAGLVIELTEHEHVRDIDALAIAVGRLRRHGVSIALDDFGDGRSSLRLWSELKPEIVKIDKYFTRELPRHPEKVQTLAALVQISQTFGSALVAEGIESVGDFMLVRDLGIRLGQGWFLGRPGPVPAAQIADEALAAVRSKDIAVFPERRRNTQQRATAWTVLREVAPVTPRTTNQTLFERFTADEGMHAAPIVEDGRPVGLIGRQQFIDRFAKPYVPEVYGRKPCTLFANLAPRTLELHASIDELTAVLTSEDQRYLSEGVIITEQGRYRGLARGEDLVRMVTEARIEAARHANPLTLLPGNIPITRHIQRLLEAGREFVACYGDLNHFKPFNDQYGYWRGDEMILTLARSIMEHTDARRDFVGHVGGDDFVILFQSDDWERRCQAIVDVFNARALDLYDEQARRDGGVVAEDREGVERFHPLTTLSIAAVRITDTQAVQRPEDVANAAAAAKRRAKKRGLGLYVDSAELPPPARA